MARRIANVRMGAIGLLMLVIVLCLAVLASLVAVTAHSGRVMAERHASAVNVAAMTEAAAQAFLSELDSWLARAQAERMPVTRLPQALEGDLASLVEPSRSVSQALSPEDALAGYDVQARMLDLEELAGAHGDEADGATRCGIAVSFSEEALSEGAERRTLDVVVVVHDDYTYGLVDWKTTTEWLDSTTDTKLWEG